MNEKEIKILLKYIKLAHKQWIKRRSKYKESNNSKSNSWFGL